VDTNKDLGLERTAEKTKCLLNVGNPCYHSVQNFVPSLILSKNLKIEV